MEVILISCVACGKEYRFLVPQMLAGEDYVACECGEAVFEVDIDTIKLWSHRLT